MDVLYLDFDGALHPDAVFKYPKPPTIRLQAPGHELFESAPLLDQLLAQYPDIRIVLSTSRVQELGFDDARGGATPGLASPSLWSDLDGAIMAHPRSTGCRATTRFWMMCSVDARHGG